jgi:putative MFS transporter
MIGGSSTSGARAAAQLTGRIENVPFSRWHRKPRIVMGSATFFDAFDALSLAFALPVLVSLWEISAAQVGVLISASNLGQLIGALLTTRFLQGIGIGGHMPVAAAYI